MGISCYQRYGEVAPKMFLALPRVSKRCLVLSEIKKQRIPILGQAQPEPVSKTQFLKAPYAWVSGHGKISLELNWKVDPTV